MAYCFGGRYLAKTIYLVYNNYIVKELISYVSSLEYITT